MTVDRASLVDNVHFNDAKKFFEALSPGGEDYAFESKENEFVVFRGDRSSEHKLIPSALREKTGGRVLYKLSDYQPQSEIEADSNLIQILREVAVLRRFFD